MYGTCSEPIVCEIAQHSSCSNLFLEFHPNGKIHILFCENSLPPLWQKVIVYVFKNGASGGNFGKPVALDYDYDYDYDDDDDDDYDYDYDKVKLWMQHNNTHVLTGFWSGLKRSWVKIQRIVLIVPLKMCTWRIVLIVSLNNHPWMLVSLHVCAVPVTNQPESLCWDIVVIQLPWRSQ